MASQPDMFDKPYQPNFDGETYVPELDWQRLTILLGRVYHYMKPGAWHSLRDIVDACGGSEASVSARLRDLRKERFGAHNVERKRVAGGLYHYRLSDD